MVVLNIVSFHPENWGKDSHFDEHIFQLAVSSSPWLVGLEMGSDTTQLCNGL